MAEWLRRWIANPIRFSVRGFESLPCLLFHNGGVGSCFLYVMLVAYTAKRCCKEVRQDGRAVNGVRFKI